MSHAATQEPDLDPYLPGRPHPGFSVQHYDLALDYRVARNRLDAVATLTLVPAVPLTRLVLQLAGLRVSAVSVDGRKPAKWTHTSRRLAIKPARELPAGVPVTVTVTYAGAPAPLTGTWGEVGWEELEDGVIVAGQPDGAPSWFPCHDHPEDKASYRIAVTAEAGYTVVSNGVLLSRTSRSSRVTWVYDQPEPMAAYLATVQIGRYELRELASGPVPIRVASPPSLRTRVDHDLAVQAPIMDAFREMFGPYPFAEYTVVVTADPLEIPLEAQGLSTFGSNHMDGASGSERLVAHELAHQWFGNSLTLRRLRDIWLHEGFACYAEWLWSERSGAATADAQARRAHARLTALPQDLTIDDPGPALMFDDRVYKRGALVLHALRLTLGDAAFFDALRAWVVARRYRHVDTDAFIACVEFETGMPVRALVERWLDAALPPLPA